MSKVILYLEDGDLSVEEWSEVHGYLEVSYKEGEDIFDKLPVLSKSQWEKLKKAGDLIFEAMEEDK